MSDDCCPHCGHPAAAHSRGIADRYEFNIEETWCGEGTCDCDRFSVEFPATFIAAVRSLKRMVSTDAAEQPDDYEDELCRDGRCTCKKADL
jgi:hypothetical protein